MVSQGRQRVEARAIILATGARERPRPARMIPGDRPSGGIYTTGHLQNLVHIQHRKVGERAVVVGAELVSWSAVLTLKHAGCHTALMTTAYPSPESYAVFNAAGKSPLMGVDVATRTRVSRIIGKPALQAVEIENLDTGDRRIVDCDTLVLTGDWIPDHELAALPASTWTQKPKAPLSIPRRAPVDPASSPSATCCTRSTPPISPPSMADTSPDPFGVPDGQTSRPVVFASWPNHRCGGSRPASCDRETSHRPATDSCRGPTPWCVSPGSWYARTARSSREGHCPVRLRPAGYSACHQASRQGRPGPRLHHGDPRLETDALSGHR